MQPTDVLLGMFDTMLATIARYRLASYPPDILIDIPDNICETHEFYKATPLIAAGRFWARETLGRLADPQSCQPLRRSNGPSSNAPST